MEQLRNVVLAENRNRFMEVASQQLRPASEAERTPHGPLDRQTTASLMDEREMLVEREFQSPNDEWNELEPVVSLPGSRTSSHRAHRVTRVDKQFLDQTIHITVSQSS